MPTFDAGHYFLTALAPIRTDVMTDDLADTSPVHALRKRLAMLPIGEHSPFARNDRNHFARFAVIDDVAYNGRLGRNTLIAAARGLSLMVAEPQDHLSCPFLLFAVEFDAASGADSERDAYLNQLWESAKEELANIFAFCVDFPKSPASSADFSRYIARCQIETTMSFNDYYVDAPALPVWPARAFKWAAIGCAALSALGLLGVFIAIVAALFGGSIGVALHWSAAAILLGALGLVGTGLAAYATIMRAGAKPFPTASDSGLPTILKALHLQRAFTRFAIDNQILAANADAASARTLSENFATFLADNRPDDRARPTQAPGVVGV